MCSCESQYCLGRAIAKAGWCALKYKTLQVHAREGVAGEEESDCLKNERFKSLARRVTAKYFKFVSKQAMKRANLKCKH